MDQQKNRHGDIPIDSTADDVHQHANPLKINDKQHADLQLTCKNISHNYPCNIVFSFFNVLNLLSGIDDVITPAAE